MPLKFHLGVFSMLLFSRNKLNNSAFFCSGKNELYFYNLIRVFNPCFGVVNVNSINTIISQLSGSKLSGIAPYHNPK